MLERIKSLINPTDKNMPKVASGMERDRKDTAYYRDPELSAFLADISSVVELKDDIAADLYPKYDVKRGLRNSNGTGVVVGLTHVGDVCGYRTENGKKIPIEGKLYYRGYDIEDIVRNCIKENRFGFEETAFLLLFGILPTQKQLNDFNKILGSKRELPDGFSRDIMLTIPSPNVMNKLAQSVLALYSYDPDPENITMENVLRQSISLIGNFPTMVSYGYQAKQSFYNNASLHLHYPDPELSTAENILRMIRPTGEFSPLEARVLDLSLILHAEHGGGNNSTFTTHLVSSTGTDTYSAISAAVGSLKGPRHGGANLAVIHMIEDLKQNVSDITNRAEVKKYLTKLLKGEAGDGSGLIYGLGHAVYTLSDPRAKLLKEMAKELATAKDMLDDFMLCDYIEEIGPALYTELTGIERHMPANVDLYSGFVYNALNIPIEIATPLFAAARIPGWCAHRLEEIISGKKLMRPAYISIQETLDYIPIIKRTFINNTDKKK